MDYIYLQNEIRVSSITHCIGSLGRLAVFAWLLVPEKKKEKKNWTIDRYESVYESIQGNVAHFNSHRTKVCMRRHFFFSFFILTKNKSEPCLFLLLT